MRRRRNSKYSDEPPLGREVGRSSKWRAAAVLSVSDLASRTVAFAITPYVARQLGPAEFGEVVLALSLIQICVVIIAFGGPGYLASAIVREGEQIGKEVWRGAVRQSRFGVLIVTGALIVVPVASGDMVPLGTSAALLVMIVAASYVQARNAIDVTFFRSTQQYRLPIVAQSGITIGNVCFTLTFISLLAPTAEWRIAAIVCSTAIFQGVYWFAGFRGTPVRQASPQIRRELLRFGGALLPHHAAYWLRTSLDRLIIAAALGLTVTGQYGLGALLSSIIVIVSTSGTQAIQPFVYRYLKAGNVALLGRVQGIACVSVGALGACLYVIVLQGFYLLFSSDFAPLLDYFHYLVIGACAQGLYLIFAQPLFYFRQVGIIAAASVVVATVYVVSVTGLALLDVVSAESLALVYALTNGLSAVTSFVLSSRAVRKGGRVDRSSIAS